MKKNTFSQAFTLSFLIFIISLGILPVRGDFTIAQYWEEGGTITFEDYYRTDFAEDIFDYDSTFEGKFSF
ncbi:MAG: hypothetical protein JSV04_05770, partial [Candidatus Heimdallarchaeota archaeon]